MRLSEAIRLGSLAIQNPRAGDTRYCAIGMGLRAIGKCDLSDVSCDVSILNDNYRANYDALAAAWPWVVRIKNDAVSYKTWLFCTFDSYVMSKRMTIEELCDMVSRWERELAAKGINVEQVTMAATQETTHEPAAEHTEKVPA